MTKIIAMCFISIMLLTLISTVHTVQGKNYQNRIYVGVYGSELYQYSSSYLPEPLMQNYSWVVDTTPYKFELTDIDRTVVQDYDDFKQYDVFLVCGPHQELISVGEFRVLDIFAKALGRLFVNSPYYPENLDVNLMHENIIKFLKAGKGFIGHCGGPDWALKSGSIPDTFSDSVIDNVSFINETDIRVDRPVGECIIDEWIKIKNSFWHGNPVMLIPRISIQDGFFQQRKSATKVGVIPYWHYFSPDAPEIGVPFTLNITNTDHPIFSDYLNHTWVVDWGGGGYFNLSQESERQGNILARYAYSDDLYLNESTKIKAWAFRPRNLGIIKYLLKYLGTGELFYHLDELSEYQEYHDWIKTQWYIESQFADKPAFLAFTYPHDTTECGRVVLTGPHSELPTFPRTEGDSLNYIATKTDLPYFNSLQDGLIEWKNDNGTPYNKDDDEPLTWADKTNYTNFYILRREIAWASNKVPDTHMPPVYGRSQAVDLPTTWQTEPEFPIICCVGKQETTNLFNLSLYYQYNATHHGENFTNWTYYDAITGLPYRFTFNATEANGNGQYRFCTKLILENTAPYELVYEEEFPPGPDTSCYIGGNITSGFSYTPPNPDDLTVITFNSTSETIPTAYITDYFWDFGDGTNSTQQNTTHQYTNNGVYTVTHTVTNNLSDTDTLSKTITVQNIEPNASFNPTFLVVRTGENITFTDTSTDADGNVIQWFWDFGDGSNASTQYPTHTYNISDYYTVSLTVTDNDNASATFHRPDCILVIDGIVNGSRYDDSVNNTWNTLQKGVDHATTSDILFIKSGWYTENLTINKSMFLIGESQQTVMLNGSVTMTNPHDYELPENGENDGFLLVNMSGNEVLLRFNNESRVGENYEISDTVYDHSGNNNTGTKYGVTWSPNAIKGKGSFIFNGVNNSINLTSLPGLSGQNVTISAWLYWSGGSGTIDPVVTQWDASKNGYCLYVNTSTDTPAFWLNGTEAVASNPLNTGWHHLVGTHDAVTLRIYVDGWLGGSASKAGQGVDTPACIGFDGVDCFMGRLDEIAVWNKTLSNINISEMYNQSYGVSLQRMTIKGSGKTGLTPSNHSMIMECTLDNHDFGVDIVNKNDVLIKCEIINCSTGIRILNSNPDVNGWPLEICQCTITNCINGILLNESSDVDIVSSVLNCSDIAILFTNCSTGTIEVISCIATGNCAPNTPWLSGPASGNINTAYTYYACTNDSDDDQLWYLFDWGDGNTTGWLGPYWSNVTVNASHTWITNGGYFVRVKAKDALYNESNWSQSILFKTDFNPPDINEVEHTPDTIGFGFNISLTADVTDNQLSNDSGVNVVTLNITGPNSVYMNHSMDYLGNATYQYVFSDTWTTGTYNYTIWTMDNAYNTNFSTGYCFNVSAQTTTAIATLADNYGLGEYINITDPPNPLEEYTLVGQGVTWNEYYNNHTGENKLCIAAAPINYQNETGIWTSINQTIINLTVDDPAYAYGYRMGNTRGLYNVYFKPDPQSTWPVAFAYNKSTNWTSYIIRSKLVGVGYLDPASSWAYQYLQPIQNSEASLDGSSIIYKNVFTGADLVWTYGASGLKQEIILSNMTKALFTAHPPSHYELSNQSYLVFITRFEAPNLHLHNASGTLMGNVTVSGRLEFRDLVNQVRCILPPGKAYTLYNESMQQRMVCRILQYNGNSYFLSGLPVAAVNNMSFPMVIDPTLNLDVTSSDGYCYMASADYEDAHLASDGEIVDTDDEMFIGQEQTVAEPSEYRIYRGYVFFNTSALPSNAVITNATLSLHKASDYSSTDFDIIVQNGQPDYPHDPLQNDDYNREQYDGVGGKLSTESFSNGFNTLMLNDFSWLTAEGVTKLCLRSSRDIEEVDPSGDEYVSVHTAEFSGFGCHSMLEIVYLNQSKIKNTGNTSISGYLLMQVEYYNETQESWEVDTEAVNETTPRTILAGEQFGLDTIFNGLVNTNDLTHGDGLYRVYVAFRDPDGNILMTSDEEEMTAWYEFEVEGLE